MKPILLWIIDEVVDEGFNYEFAAQMQEAQSLDLEIKVKLAKVRFT
ncbi:hypothetical protein [Nostoc sp.]